jgi:hypothetical protein
VIDLLEQAAHADERASAKLAAAYRLRYDRTEVCRQAIVGTSTRVLARLPGRWRVHMGASPSRRSASGVSSAGGTVGVPGTRCCRRRLR